MIYVKNIKTDNMPNSKRHVYVGRRNASYNVPESPLHNPFPLKYEFERMIVVELYTKYLDEQLGHRNSWYLRR